jgi:sulfate permease, SulP family
VKRRKTVILAGPLPRPHSIFGKANLHQKHASVWLAPNLGAAIGMAGEVAPTPSLGPPLPDARPSG